MTKTKKIVASLCAAATLVAAGSVGLAASTANTKATTKSTVSVAGYNGAMPKYIFMFIGDGMSFPQTQLTADYYNALKDTNDNGILEAKGTMNFMRFPVVGSANTYDSSSFCPDSVCVLCCGKTLNFTPRIHIFQK